ncbi:MAG: NADPH2:quinone reductase [Rhodothermales bacterium]|jgi:NADPH2:quinone reductase
MKAAFIRATGAPDVIQIDDLPVRQAGPGEVLVRVTAVALNPIDTYIRSGEVEMPLPEPYIIGCDLAGTVEKIGKDVTRFEVGERVWGSNQGVAGRQGTFAEFATVHEDWLYETPDNVSDEDAAACALTALTAHLGLSDAGMGSDDVLFVNGGSGGVGSMVLQMGKAIGCTVIATAGSDERVAACRELGADLAINYKTSDVAAAVAEFAEDGIDVHWECSREPDFATSIGMMAERGRLIVMAGRDAAPAFPVGPFYVKGCSLHGFVIFKFSAEVQQESASDINAWLAAGKLKAKIDRVMPLDQAAEAHRLQEENTLHGAGTVSGKIILKP